MRQRTFNFVYNNLYSLGGAVVVSGIYVLTGVFVAAVVGYLIGLGLTDILPRILR